MTKEQLEAMAKAASAGAVEIYEANKENELVGMLSVAFHVLSAMLQAGAAQTPSSTYPIPDVCDPDNAVWIGDRLFVAAPRSVSN